MTRVVAWAGLGLSAGHLSQQVEEDKIPESTRLGTQPSRNALRSLLAFAFHRKQHRLLCVTDRTIVLMDADRHWAPKAIITVLPRNIEFGPMARGRWSTLWGLGGGLYVNESFYGEVEAADAALTSAA